MRFWVLMNVSVELWFAISRILKILSLLEVVNEVF